MKSTPQDKTNLDPNLEEELTVSLSSEVSKRRNFAIISHPDAGKTTLTEKLLLYGGAIQQAGAVKARGEQRKVTSDWMEIEKQRGISITSTVLQFAYKEKTINLLDTPGHQDFSEDTYRTLAAADNAVMLEDAAKGLEPQTRKLFEVCRMRQIPIFTFINKMDRPGQEPLELLDEIESELKLVTLPINWPIGIGLDIHRVRKRNYDMRFDLLDYETTVGHFSLYYDAGGLFDVEINAGRYLAGDIGVTTTISREFGSGWRVGGYATLTDVPFENFGEGSFDKAIFVSIPIDWITSTPTQVQRILTLRPITRDGGANLASARSLNRHIKRLHNAAFRREYGRLWK